MNGNITPVTFSEVMHGRLTQVAALRKQVCGEYTSEDLKALCRSGYRGGIGSFEFKFSAEINIQDLSVLKKDSTVPCEMRGNVGSVRYGDCPFSDASWVIFKPTVDPDVLHMEYRFFFKDQDGAEKTLVGFKDVSGSAPWHMWRHTTTLYTFIYRGRVSAAVKAPVPEAAGVLRLNPIDLFFQVCSMRSAGGGIRQLGAIMSFLAFFAQKMLEVYFIPGQRPYHPPFPPNTLEGVTGPHPEARVIEYPVKTEDGFALTLTRFTTGKCRDAVVIMHGLTTSSDMFIMPEHKNLVSCLLENGFSDVWCFDSRMSRRFKYNEQKHRCNLDEVAFYDIPACFGTVRRHAEENARIHVIAHCLGSVTFMMALFSGHAGDICSAVCNSVALHPRVRLWSRIKLILGPFLVENLLRLPFLSPAWNYTRGPFMQRFSALLVRLKHWECHSPACRMASFLWGTGWPAVYEHENLHPVTHYRLCDLFGGTGLNFHRHISKMVSAGEAVKFDTSAPRFEFLPEKYMDRAKDVHTSLLLISGSKNKIFPGSARETKTRLIQAGMLNCRYSEFDDYGHQDVFMGKNSAAEVFPEIINFIEQKKNACIKNSSRQQAQ